MPANVKPKPDSTRPFRERFIRDKYEKLLWADPERVSKAAGATKTKTSALYKEGFLTEQTGSSIGFNSGKKRWCVLRLTANSATLFYYRNRGDTTPAGEIDLFAVAIRPKSATSHHAFEIITPARIHVFYAATANELREWLGRIQEILAICESAENMDEIFAE